MNDTIGIIKPNYGHKGDFAILKGTLTVFRQLGVNIDFLIDPDVDLPENLFTVSIIRTWPTIFQQNVVCGKGIKKQAYLKALTTLLTWRPKVDIDLLWYIGGVRFGAISSRYAIAELLYSLYLKHHFKAKMIFGGISIAIGKNTLSKLYTSFIYKKAIMNVDYILVRDKQSFNFLRMLGYPANKLSFVCDFAFHIDPKRTTKTDEISSMIKECEKPVGIIPDVSKLKHPKSDFDNEYFQRLLKLVQKLKNEGFTVLLIPLSNTRLANTPPYTQDDYEACIEVNTRLGISLPVIKTKNLEPEEIIQIMQDLDCIISVGRLHGAVFGCLANIPTIHIYFEEKSLMLKDLFGGDFPLFWCHDWLTHLEIDNKIVSFIKNPPTVNYRKEIDIWRKRSLEEVKQALKILEVL